MVLTGAVSAFLLVWPPERAPVWAALMASTSCAFFMLPAPAMPMPPAIDFRSAISMELSPPPRFLPVLSEAAALPVDDADSEGVEDSMVSVT